MFLKAINLIFSFDYELYSIIWTSLYITFFSILISSGISIPLCFLIDSLSIKLKKIITSLINSLTALPTVIIGLFVYNLISKNGIFGFSGLLYTPKAIIIGQSILAIPIISSIIISGFSKNDERLYETLISFGCSKFEIYKKIFLESKHIFISAIMTGFGRIIGEVGISMMLGGNIRFYTRTLTTTIALESNKGNFEFALSLGLILLFISILINFLSFIFIKGEDIWNKK